MNEKFYPIVPLEDRDEGGHSPVSENNSIIKHGRDPKTGKIIVDSLTEAFVLAQREMLEHLDFFSETEKNVVQRRFVNINQLTGAEYRVFDEARDRWWTAQYGVPYSKQGGRKRVILAKYIVSGAKVARRRPESQQSAPIDKNIEQTSGAVVVGPKFVNPEQPESTEKIPVASLKEAENLELAEMAQGQSTEVSNIIVKVFHGEEGSLSPKEQSLLANIRQAYYKTRYGISYVRREARIKALKTRYAWAEETKGTSQKAKSAKLQAADMAQSAPTVLYKSALETKLEKVEQTQFISEPPFWTVETEDNIEQMDNKVLSAVYQAMAEVKSNPQVERIIKQGGDPYRLEVLFLKSLRDQMVQQYPDYAEIICALVNFDRACEWQSLTGHLLFNNKDKKFAQKFWDVHFRIAQLFQVEGGVIGVYGGIMGQVGVCKTLEALNLKFSSATPSEDATEKTDLWLGSQRIQIKHRANPNSELIVYETEEVLYPNAVISTPEQNVHIINSDAADIATIGESAEGLSQKLKKRVKVLKIICPATSFNRFTGEPTQEFLSKIEPILRAQLESAP